MTELSLKLFDDLRRMITGNTSGLWPTGCGEEIFDMIRKAGQQEAELSPFDTVRQQKIIMVLLDSILVWDRWLDRNKHKLPELEYELHDHSLRYFKFVIKQWRRKLTNH